MNELYDPLIERDLAAVPAAARAFLAEHSEEELWIAVARFAVLAYAPSQHAKRAVLAVRAAYELRDAMGERWVDLIIECARYSAESRPPWSEPPILDPPPPSDVRDVDELRAAIASNDRLRAERWLAARVDDADEDLRAVARGDALLVTDAVLALAPLLGEKGRYALLRVAIWEMLADHSEEAVTESLDALIDDVIASKGSLESVRRVLIWAAGRRPAARPASGRPHIVYRLAHDYAQTLLAHAAALCFPPTAKSDAFLAAVHENLAHGEGYEEWSFA